MRKVSGGLPTRAQVGRQRDGDPIVRAEAPNTKLQHPEKHQAPRSKNPVWDGDNKHGQVPNRLSQLKESWLGLGLWSFSAAWCLELGAFIPPQGPCASIGS